MKKNNPIRKGMSVLLALAMCMALPLAVLAEEKAPPGSNRDDPGTEVTVTDQSGNAVVTVKIGEELAGNAAENREKQEWTETVKPGQTVPPVRVELIPGKETTVSITEVSDVRKEGDLPKGSDDKEYDYTETTIITDRQVHAESSDIHVTVQGENTDINNPLRPEDYEGKQYDQGTIGPGNQPSGLVNSTQTDYNFPADPKPSEEGYDYLIAGDGEGTFAACPVFMKVVYKKDEEGNALKDDAGNYIVESAELTYCNSTSVSVQSGMNSPAQITLKKDGDYFYTYCIDSEISAKPGKWYKITNLEDSDYFADEESAAKLRTIVANGYWGTDATIYETNEDGTIRTDPETGKPIPQKDENGEVVRDETTAGSLERMKALMRETYGEEDYVTVQDKDGNDVRYKVLDLIDGLKEHEALAVTQGAIWSYSNGSQAVENGKDGEKVIGIFSAIKYFSSSGGWLDAYDRAYDTQSDARMQALYTCLMELDPIHDSAEGVTTIINEKNAVEDIFLTVQEKAEGYAENTDDNADNDVFETDLNFTLAFVPDPKNDDLLVYLTDSEGNPLCDRDGSPIIRRLAGADSEGRTHETILPDEKGVYTLTGLQLAENEDFVFDLRLEGTQYLKEGVYIYTAHGGRNASQTLVGMAEGQRDVEIAVGMNISFQVDESNKVVAERVWYKTDTPGNDSGKKKSQSTFRLLHSDQAQMDDRRVLPAESPATGDSSLILAAISTLSGVGYASLSITARRKG